MTFKFPRRLLPFAALFLLAAPFPARADGDVNIYTYREPGLIRPLIEAFEKKTGIKAHTVFDTAGSTLRLPWFGFNLPAL